MKTHLPGQAISESKRDSTETKTVQSPNKTCDNIATLSPSNNHRRSKPQQTTFDSQTNVNFSNYIKMEWKSENREVVGFRANKELYLDFKKVAKDLYGSTCRAFEFFMASLVLATRQKVNLCLTDKPINFGKVVIERNIRTRRKLVVEEEETETVMADIRQRERDAELEKIFSGALAQWSQLKPSAKAFHLKRAKANSHLKSARLLLDLEAPE